jgi:hypothetical protein
MKLEKKALIIVESFTQIVVKTEDSFLVGCDAISSCGVNWYY